MKSNRIVFTADTAVLQRFLVKHLKTQTAWKNDSELQISPASSPSR